jgi:hypothetical protein
MDVNNIYKPEFKDTPTPNRQGWKIAVSCFVSFVLFALFVALITIVLGKQIATKSVIKSAVKELDIANMDLSEVFDVEEGTNLTDYVYDEVKEFEEFKDVTKDDIKQFLDEDVSDYFAGELEKYVDVIRTGEGNVSININEIVDIIEESDNEILKDIEITPEIKEEIKASIDELEIDTITTETITGEYSEVFNKIRNSISTSKLVIAIVSIVLLSAILVVINFRYIKSWMLHISIPMIIAGALFLIAGIVLKVVNITMSFDFGVLINSAIEAVKTAFTGKIFIMSGAVLGAGVVITIVAAIISSIMDTKTENA